MKRLKFVFILFLLLTADLTLNLQSAFAADPGTFDCITNATGQCVVGTKNCPGMNADPGVCAALPGGATCNGAVNNACIAPTPTPTPTPTPSTCTVVNKNKCGVCPDPKQYCKEGIAGSVSCEFVNGQCGFGAPPGPTIEPYNPECDSGAGVKSALGCLPVNATTFTNTAMPWAIGLGSGIAFLLGIYGAFLIATASGDPEKVQAGKELITSAVLGVVVIIFAITILAVTGETILKLF